MCVCVAGDCLGLVITELTTSHGHDVPLCHSFSLSIPEKLVCFAKASSVSQSRFKVVVEEKASKVSVMTATDSTVQNEYRSPTDCM